MTFPTTLSTACSPCSLTNRVWNDSSPPPSATIAALRSIAIRASPTTSTIRGVRVAHHDLGIEL